MTGLLEDIFRFNEHNRDQWIERVARTIPAGSKVLDLAAGTCPYRTLFQHCDYKAQDFKQLPDLLNRDGEAYGVIDYVCDITSVPLADASMDVVLCTEALEHVPDPAAVIRESARVLRPGGQIILTAPLGSGLHQEPYHFFGGFTPHWYQRTLTQYGFNDLRIEANRGTFKHLSQETLRFVLMSAPWSLTAPLWVQGLWLPLWLGLTPILGILMPLLCHWLDRYERAQAFTVGYFVLALKR